MFKSTAVAAFALAASIASAQAGNASFPRDLEAKLPIGLDKTVRAELNQLGIDAARIDTVRIDTVHVKRNEDSPVLRRDVLIRLKDSGDTVRLSFNGANRLNLERSYVVNRGERQPFLARAR